MSIFLILSILRESIRSKNRIGLCRLHEHDVREIIHILEQREKVRDALITVIKSVENELELSDR